MTACPHGKWKKVVTINSEFSLCGLILVLIKCTVSGYKGRVLLFQKHLKSTAQRDRQARASAGSIAGRMASTTLTAVV